MNREEIELIHEMQMNCLKATTNEVTYKDEKAKDKYLALLHIEEENKQLKKENKIMIGAVKILDQMSKAKILTFDKETLTVTFNYDEASTFIDNQNKYLTQKLKASEQEKENLIKYLESEIYKCKKEYKLLKYNVYTSKDAFEKILKKVKSGNYE